MNEEDNSLVIIETELDHTLYNGKKDKKMDREFFESNDYGGHEDN